MSALAASLKPGRGGTPWPVLAAIAVGWTLAVAAELTGAAATLHHDALIEHGPPLWLGFPLFLLAWQAMLAAMMLPSSLPLIRLFRAVSARQARPASALAAFLGGYALVWTAFAGLAFFGDGIVHRAVDASPWLAAHPWLIGGSVLAAAGLFQFSDVKEQCLSKCRQPGPYLFAHYRRGRAGAFRLAVGHALFCVGCCWALMLLMFAAGVAVLWWMAALTAVMVYEKTGRHGAAITPSVGLVLLALAGVAFAHPAWFPTPFVH